MDIPAGTADSHNAFFKVTEHGIHWIVDQSCHPLIADALLPMLLHPGTSDGCRIVRENKVRRSVLIRHPQLREAFFAKLYKKPEGTDRLKYLFLPSKAYAEWNNMLKMFKQGLPVPRPLARGEKRSHLFLREAYLFTTAIEGAVSLSDMAAGKPPLLHKITISENAARLVSETHKKGFFFRDLHAGNILIFPGSADKYRMCLVDFHKAWHTRWVPLWMRARDLAQLKNSLTVSQTGQLRFLKSYLRHSNLCADCLSSFSRNIDRKAERMWNTHLKSRTKRCLKESTEFSVNTRDTYTMYRHRFYPEALIDTLLENYHTVSRDHLMILKKTPKETVSLLSATYDGEAYRVVIKESLFNTFFARLRNSIFRSRARRNWIGTKALRVRGISTPDALALLEYRAGVLMRRTLLLTRYVEQSHELNEYVLMRYNRTLSEAELRRKKRFIAALAGLIRDMHQKGIYHADLKSNNILVREEGDAWKLSVIDLDRIGFRSSLSFNERANNLAQMNASVAACITPVDRMLFFKHYAQGSDLAKQGKKYFKQIMKIGRKKNTRPYGLIFKQR